MNIAKDAGLLSGSGVTPAVTSTGRAAAFAGKCSAALRPSASEAPNQSWQHMLRSLNAKGGERKRLTVLFADIRNSTRLIDSLGDPELGMRRLQPVLELMNEAVRRYDGVVNKTQGDGVMALFGAPQPHEDHAVRGCLAALDDAGCKFQRLAIRGSADPRWRSYRGSRRSGHRERDLPDLRCGRRKRAPGKSNGADGGRRQHPDHERNLRAAKQFVEVEPLGSQAVRGHAAANRRCSSSRACRTLLKRGVSQRKRA